MKTLRVLVGFVSALSFQPATLLCAAPAFEGRIEAVIAQGSETTPLLYTVGTNQLRIEVTATNRPHPVDLVDRSSGALTLVFPHNRSFVRLKPTAEAAPAMPPGMFPMPVPAGIAPQPGSAAAAPTIRSPPGGHAPGIGPQPVPMEKLELKATGQKTNLLGCACERFELKQRGETLEVWATDQLFPFQPYRQTQPHRFGPGMLEEQWPGLLQRRNLFPLRVSLRFESGPERYRFEIKSIRAEKIADPAGRLFQPPPDYHEIEPLPF